MKKHLKITSIIIAIILFISATVGIFIINKTDSDRNYENFYKDEELVLKTNNIENDFLSLSIDTDTTVVSVKNKITGKVWTTNPILSEQSDGTKEILSSQIVINYVDVDGDEGSVNNYKHSILKKQFLIGNIENGIKVSYSIGESQESVLFPEIIDKESMDKYLEKLSESEQEKIKGYYNFYSYSKLDTNAQKEISNTYPAVKKHDIYVCRKLATKPQKKLAELFRATGITVSDLNKIYEKLGFESQLKEKPFFKMAIEYILDGDKLSVRVPKESVDYNRESFYIKSFSLLKQFGAQQTNSDGYLFVPDGSGAIIDFSGDENELFSKKVYGIDYSFANIKFNGYGEHISMPVFGIKSGENAMFAVIKENAAMATISAGNSGNHGYYYNSCSFDVTSSEFYRLKQLTYDGKTYYSETAINSDYEIDYYFLSGEKANYSGMAEIYRAYLFADKEKTNSNANVFIQSYGAVDVKNTEFGIPIKYKRALNKYDDVVAVVDELNELGINVNYIYRGWNDDGMKSSVTSKIKTVGVLGSKSDFKKMLSSFKNNNNLFLDTQFSYSFKNTLTDKFSPTSDTAKCLDNSIAKHFDFCPATLKADPNTAKYIISADRYMFFANSFIQSAKNFDIKGIMVSGLGQTINSNFERNGKTLTRSDSVAYTKEVTKVFSSESYNIIAEYGNAYILSDADYLINVPMQCSELNIESYGVPFVSMVLHGYINFASEPINMSSDPQVALLQAVETGTGIHYLVNNSSIELVKNTDFSGLYSTEFALQKSKIVDSYNKIGEYLKGVSNTEIKLHSILSNDLRVTEFENGIISIVNYTDKDCEYNGKIVGANDFLIING